MTTLLWMFAAVIATTIYFVVARRRRTPHLELNIDSLPPLQNGVTALAGLTGASVHCGNQATVLQNGALFDSIEKDIQTASYTIHLETFVW